MADKLSLKDAQAEFVAFLSKLKPKAVAPFLRWVEDSFSTEKEENKPKMVRDALEKMLEIAEHVKQKVPVHGSLSSEKILWPKVGHDSDCNETNTVHVDCFLFDDDAVDDLVEQGELTRNYCVDCGSKNTKPLTFISHSLASPQLEFMFTELVPLKSQKEDFTVVDIGSRLGTVIYAASLYSNSRAKVIGIEMNEDLCKLQNEVIEEFELQNISVLCSDVRNQQDIIAQANLIVMNNVFSFFMSIEEQKSCWQFLFENVPAGCMIIHNPDIADVLAHLEIPFTLENWLEKISTASQCAKFAGDNEALFEDCANLAFYRVKEKV